MPGTHKSDGICYIKNRKTGGVCARAASTLEEEFDSPVADGFQKSWLSFPLNKRDHLRRHNICVLFSFFKVLSRLLQNKT
jgi:hypothetical protein